MDSFDTVNVSNGRIETDDAYYEECCFACGHIFNLGITFGDPADFENCVSICEDCLTRGSNMVGWIRHMNDFARKVVG